MKQLKAHQIEGGGAGGGTADSTEFTPTGTLSATTVQEALAELDAEKAPAQHPHDYAPTVHTHDYAATGHTHDYAATGHAHSAYAPVGHTHVGEGGGPAALDDLSDVDTTTSPPTPGQALLFNGTVWKPGDSGIDGGGEGGSSFAPDAGRSPRLVPFGVKLRGANIIPRGGTAANPWGAMYAAWATEWGTGVKPQIDAAASVGANAIRLMGDIGGVHSGALTLEAYVAAYEQFVDYCANLGLWVYAQGGDLRHYQGATVAQALTIVKALAAMLETKRNVFAFDVQQEVAHTAAPGMSTYDFVNTMVTGVREVSTLPLTCSVLEPNNGSAAQFSGSVVAAYDGLLDFFDFHPYYDSLSLADMEPAFAATTKPILLGEYGADATKPGRYAAVAAVSADRRVVGSFVWAIVDYNASGAGGAWGPTGAWGLFDYNFGERETLTKILRTVPDHQGTLPGAGHTLLDEGVTLPARARINFVGDGVTVADDHENDTTTVTVPGATTEPEPDPVPRSGELLMQDGVTAPPVPLENETRDDWLYEG